MLQILFRKLSLWFVIVITIFLFSACNGGSSGGCCGTNPQTTKTLGLSIGLSNLNVGSSTTVFISGGAPGLLVNLSAQQSTSGVISLGATTCTLNSQGACSVPVTALAAGSAAINASASGYAMASGVINSSVNTFTINKNVFACPYPSYPDSIFITALINGVPASGVPILFSGWNPAFIDSANTTQFCVTDSNGRCNLYIYTINAGGLTSLSVYSANFTQLILDVQASIC
jgi:hypothetical protein